MLIFAVFCSVLLFPCFLSSQVKQGFFPEELFTEIRAHLFEPPLVSLFEANLILNSYPYPLTPVGGKEGLLRC